jgi:hypothetical protein
LDRKTSIQNFVLIAQTVLLVVNAYLVWKYLQATRSIQSSAVEQAEGLARPALVVVDEGRGLWIKNIGNGPGIDVRWSAPFLGVLGDAQPEPYLRGSVAFLQEKDYISLAFSTALGVCRE